ncbi:MAG: monovalent cation/H(+) antiporter subunit G [Mangrovicoccus sp.]|nr:monovalent cation/H(+) antiporter subunit G [Mangrovicoccus sp.]
MIVTALIMALVIAGGAFAFFAGLGVLRLPGVLNKMHASTKAGTLGCTLTIAAAAVHFGDTSVSVRAIATVLFLLLTAPIAAHMIGRAAYRVEKNGKDTPFR